MMRRIKSLDGLSKVPDLWQQINQDEVEMSFDCEVTAMGIDKWVRLRNDRRYPMSSALAVFDGID